MVNKREKEREYKGENTKKSSLAYGGVGGRKFLDLFSVVCLEIQVKKCLGCLGFMF